MLHPVPVSIPEAHLDGAGALVERYRVERNLRE
jgi:hypothetical protein